MIAAITPATTEANVLMVSTGFSVNVLMGLPDLTVEQVSQNSPVRNTALQSKNAVCAFGITCKEES